MALSLYAKCARPAPSGYKRARKYCSKRRKIFHFFLCFFVEIGWPRFVDRFRKHYLIVACKRKILFYYYVVRERFTDERTGNCKKKIDKDEPTKGSFQSASRQNFVRFVRSLKVNSISPGLLRRTCRKRKSIKQLVLLLLGMYCFAGNWMSSSIFVAFRWYKKKKQHITRIIWIKSNTIFSENDFTEKTVTCVRKLLCSLIIRITDNHKSGFQGG